MTKKKRQEQPPDERPAGVYVIPRRIREATAARHAAAAGATAPPAPKAPRAARPKKPPTSKARPPRAPTRAVPAPATTPSQES